jgi:hypothetical protein
MRPTLPPTSQPMTMPRLPTASDPAGAGPAGRSRGPDEAGTTPRPSKRQDLRTDIRQDIRQESRPEPRHERERSVRLMTAPASAAAVAAQPSPGESRTGPLSNLTHDKVVAELGQRTCEPLAVAMWGVLAGLEAHGTTLQACRGANPEVTLMNLADRWRAFPTALKATGEYRAVLDNAFHTYGPGGPLGDNGLYLSVREGLDGRPGWRESMKELLHGAAGTDGASLPTGAARPAPTSQAVPPGAQAGPSQPAQAAPQQPVVAPARPAGSAGSASHLTPLSQQRWSEISGAISSLDRQTRRDALHLRDTATGPAQARSPVPSQVPAQVAAPGAGAGPSSRPEVGAATRPAASRGPLVPSSLEDAGVRGPALRILQRAVADQVLGDAAFDELLRTASPRTLAQAIRYMVPNLMKPVTESDDDSGVGAPGGARPASEASTGPASPDSQDRILPPPPVPNPIHPPVPAFDASPGPDADS